MRCGGGCRLAAAEAEDAAAPPSVRCWHAAVLMATPPPALCFANGTTGQEDTGRSVSGGWQGGG